MLPIFFVALPRACSSSRPQPTSAPYAWLAIILAMAIDGFRVSAGIKAGVRERFGEDETKGITWYALTRAWQMRRLRLPKPQVQTG